MCLGKGVVQARFIYLRTG